MSTNLQRPPLRFDINERAGANNQRNSFFFQLPFVYGAIFTIVLIYLNIPTYLEAFYPSLLPKYWYFGMAALYAPWILASLSGNAPYSHAPFTMWAAAFTSLLAIHLLVALSDNETVRADIIATTLQYVVLAALQGMAFSAIPQKHYSFIFPLISAAIAATLIVDFVFPNTLYATREVGTVVGRAGGTYFNSTRAGEGLIITLIFSFIRLRGLPLLLLLLFSGAATLLTFSRAAIMGWVLLWPIALYNRILPRYTYGVLFGVVFVLPIVTTTIVTYMSTSPELLEGLNNIQNRLLFFENYSLEDDSGSARSEILAIGLQTFLDHPIFGAGSGYTYVWQYGISTHNEVALFLAEYGLIGLFFWIWLLAILWNGRYFAKRWHQISAALYFVYFSMFTHNMLDAIYWTFSFALFALRSKARESLSPP
ncbi:MAG: O-antigen ligase family protein [Rhodomicrobium sp.]